MRCPACDAANPESAAWCNQCYAGLDEPDASPPSERSRERAPAGESEAFRHVDGRFQWACARCQTYNPIEADACVACGSPMMARFVEEEQPSAEDHARAQRATLLLPGAGHYILGQQGSGLARAVLFVVWAVGGLALIITGDGATFAAAPLLLGAAVLYAASVVDVRNLESGRAELLAGRTLLWLVVVVTGLLLLGAFLGARGEEARVGLRAPTVWEARSADPGAGEEARVGLRAPTVWEARSADFRAEEARVGLRAPWGWEARSADFRAEEARVGLRAPWGWEARSADPRVGQP